MSISTIVAFPNVRLTPDAPRDVEIEFPMGLNRLSIRGSRFVRVLKFEIGMGRLVLFDGMSIPGELRGISGDVLLHGVRLYDGPDRISAAIKARAIVMNIDVKPRDLELYARITLRDRHDSYLLHRGMV